jgi:hypothetical protein
MRLINLTGTGSECGKRIVPLLTLSVAAVFSTVRNQLQNSMHTSRQLELIPEELTGFTTIP